MPTVIGIEHVQLAMPPGGEEQARAFYAGLLGIPERNKPSALEGRGGCWFQSPGVKIHLGVEAQFRPARKAHPGLLVSDLKGILSRLKSAGAQVSPGELVDGFDRAYVEDPFGNRLELMEPSSRR